MMKKRVNELFGQMEKKMVYLYSRWQDEREYEDFNEYINAARPAIEANGARFVKMTRKPFAVYFGFPELPRKLFYIVVTSREYKLMVKNI